MIFAGLLAGGSGTRMESATEPKQFLRLGGIPIFIRSLRNFFAVGQIRKVFVSTNEKYHRRYLEFMDEFQIDPLRVTLVPGGESRFLSLANVVKAAAEEDDDPESAIITHDCARIFTSPRIILDNIEAIADSRIVTTSIPVIDTVIESDDGEFSSRVPNRSRLWADQGPQTFRIQEFMTYFSMVPQQELPTYIEAGKLFLANGHKVRIVRGDRLNFKITNDLDLHYAEYLIQNGVVK